jgi:hypothetical protein
VKLKSAKQRSTHRHRTPQQTAPITRHGTEHETSFILPECCFIWRVG